MGFSPCTISLTIGCGVVRPNRSATPRQQGQTKYIVGAADARFHEDDGYQHHQARCASITTSPNGWTAAPPDIEEGRLDHDHSGSSEYAGLLATPHRAGPSFVLLRPGTVQPSCPAHLDQEADMPRSVRTPKPMSPA